jgi:DNA-directed RNA polymerase specialized sigma24 family protein
MEYATFTDLQLVTRARAGDDPAFAELVRRYHSLVRAIASPAVGTADAAEVAAQTFAHAARHLHDPAADAFCDWIRQVAANRTLDYAQARLASRTGLVAQRLTRADLAG